MTYPGPNQEGSAYSAPESGNQPDEPMVPTQPAAPTQPMVPTQPVGPPSTADQLGVPTQVAPSPPSPPVYQGQPLGYPPMGSPVPPPAVSGPPVPEPPVSGAFGYPAAAYPVSAPGAPYAMPTRRGPATMVLAILSVVFFLATALFTTLYITKTGAYNDKVRSSNTQAAADQSRIKDLQTQLQTAQDQLTTLQQQQRGTQDQLDEITKEKQVIQQCLTLLVEAGTAAQNKAPNASQLADQADQACSEAQKYLN